MNCCFLKFLLLITLSVTFTKAAQAHGTGKVHFDPNSRSWTVSGVEKTDSGNHTETGSFAGEGPHHLTLGNLGMGWRADKGGFLGRAWPQSFIETDFDRYQPDTFEWEIQGGRWDTDDGSALFGSSGAGQAGGFRLLLGGSPGTEPQLDVPIPRGTVLDGKLSWQSQTGTAGTGTLVYEADDPGGFGDHLRVYRLALAATGEFTTFHGGEEGALEALKKITAELNTIFNRDLSIHLELIPDEDLKKIIYTDPGSDPYTPEDLPGQLEQNQTTLDNEIGADNYDVGHVLGRLVADGAGLSTFYSVGQPGFKGQGVTAAFEPTIYSSPFIGLLAHELGHQFGADHTFNSDGSDFCEQERNESTAVEPGSGSSLMAYPGFCGAGDLQEERDHYFHALSIEQIETFITENLDAAPHEKQHTGNRIPVLVAGKPKTIPARTPFMLTAMASDPDGEELQYNWEQMDVGGALNFPTASTDGPLFRSRPPSASPVRTFPAMEDLLNGTTDPAEVLPATSRNLNFRATVRDSGGVNWGDVALSVVDTGSAFAVTFPNGSESLDAWSNSTIEWDVAGTGGSGIDTAAVHVYLSLDSGRTFPTFLKTVPNTGAASIRIPPFVSSTARILIQGAGNVFFDVSDQDFNIVRPPNSPYVSIPSEIRGLYGETVTQYIRLNTPPNGDVSIRAVASEGVQLSLDDSDYGDAVEVSLNNSNYLSGVPVSVKVFLDADFSKLGRITYEVVESTSEVYTNDFPIATTEVKLKLPPQATATGVLFDVNQIDPDTTRWNQLSTWGFFLGKTTLTDLQWEDGAEPDQVGATPQEVDLFIDRHGVGTWQQAPVIPLPRTMPLGMPEPEKMDHVFIHSSTTKPISFTWQDLKPNSGYNVFICTAQNFNAVIDQTVTITGSGENDPEPFVQKVPANANRRLLINSEFGFERRELQSYGVPVISSAAGEIDISVLANAGTAGVFLNAVRIQEQFPVAQQIPVSVEETTLAEAETVDFGTASATRLGRGAVTKEFTLKNQGIGTSVSELWASVRGLHRDDFQIDREGMRRFLEDGESTTFSVNYYPNGAGERQASLQIGGRFGPRGRYLSTFTVNLTGVATESLQPDTDAFGGAGDHFGSAVAIHEDLAIVGAPSDETEAGAEAGTALIFVLDATGNWKRYLKLAASDGAPDLHFGQSVSAGLDVLAVGAKDAVYIFRPEGLLWVETAKLQASDLAIGDDFGRSIALSASGETLLVGAPSGNQDGNTAAGSAYVFTKGAEGWTEQKLTATPAVASSNMGAAVAIHGDLLAVGLPGAKSAAGRVLTYTKGASAWELASTIENPAPTTSTDFGTALALTEERLLVGLTDAARLFLKTAEGDWDEETVFSGAPGIGFGGSVALGEELILIGAEDADTEAGQAAGTAQVYIKSTDQWLPRELLTAEDAAAGDRFGHAVALSGLSAMVGAPDHDGPVELGIPLDDQGSVYAYPLAAPAARMDLRRLNEMVLKQGSVVEFGEVAIGATGEATIRITNTGDILLTGIAMALEGEHQDDYTLTYDGGMTIDPGMTEEMLVEFKPMTAGTRCATLRVLSSDTEASSVELTLKGTAAPAEEVFGSAILAAGLSGVETLPGAEPFDDGVPNLLKYAFNMELARADASTLVPGGDSGLPGHEVNTGDSGETIFVVEFIRRKGSGLVYTPKRADSPENDLFVPMTGAIQIIYIDDEWERVRVEERCPADTPRCFSHVEVSLP